MAKPAGQAKPQGKPAMAKSGGKRVQKGGPEVLGLLLVSGGALLFLAIVALPVCILLILGMIPTVVAFLIDQTPRRTLTFTIGPLNLAGTAPYCIQLWFGVDTLYSLNQYLTSVWVWLIMYSAAGIGWLLHFGMPMIVRFVLEQSLDHRKSRLVQFQEKLRKEWGKEVDSAAEATASGKPGR